MPSMARSNLLTGEQAKAPFRAGEAHVVKVGVELREH